MKKCTFIFFILFILLSSPVFAENKPRLGLSLDSLAASPMLSLHLQIPEGEGLIINNVVTDSPLDKLGVTQGDILLSIDGVALSQPNDLSRYIQAAKPNQSVVLEIIQRGERKRLSVLLDKLPDDIVWKYARPVANPARIPLLSPMPQTPSQSSVKKLSSGAQHMVIHSQVRTPNGMETSTVTIDGDPSDENSDIRIELSNQTYEGKIKDISQFPEVARKAAQDALAQSNFSQFPRGITFGSFMPRSMEEFFLQQMEEMQRTEEMFFRRAQPNAPTATPSAPVPTPSPIQYLDSNQATGNKL